MFTLRGSPSSGDTLLRREPPARLGSTKGTASVSRLNLEANGLRARAPWRPSRDTMRRRTMRRIKSGEGAAELFRVSRVDTHYNHRQRIRSLRTCLEVYVHV